MEMGVTDLEPINLDRLFLFAFPHWIAKGTGWLIRQAYAH